MTNAPAKIGISNRPTTAALGKRGMGLQLTEGWTRRIPSPYALRKGGFRSGRLGAEQIFREPGLSVLFEGCGAQQPSRDKHFVRRLQDALEMRRRSLHERQLRRQAFQ